MISLPLTVESSTWSLITREAQSTRVGSDVTESYQDYYFKKYFVLGLMVQAYNSQLLGALGQEDHKLSPPGLQRKCKARLGDFVRLSLKIKG